MESEGITSESISVTRCRELLGSAAEELTDQDIDSIRQHAEKMARIILDMFLEIRATERI